MNSIIKDLAVLLFAAGDEIERKAEEIKKRREERFSMFYEKIREKQEDFTSKHAEEIQKAKDRLSEIANKAGLATKAEIDDMKNIVSDIDKKLDKLMKEK
ncbi:MAG: hypothetical protein SVZ03_03480 [Spirochaetota bacterium]|nr:hypothetical protein [Spirochaetota bacterium]